MPHFILFFEKSVIIHNGIPKNTVIFQRMKDIRDFKHPQATTL